MSAEKLSGDPAKHSLTISLLRSDISFYAGINMAFFLTVILFFAGLLFDPFKIQYSLFFRSFYDLFADFFNHIIYVSEGSPYLADDQTAADRVLPPLHYLLAYGVRQFIDCPMTLESMWKDKTAMGCAITFLAFSEVFLLVMLSKITEGKNKFLPLLMVLFSGVNMFAVERGTMVIFTTGCIAGFLHCYDSTERKKQIFSLILLSLAASLKIYPALFGLFLLKKRDFKAVLFCIVLTAGLGFLPLLMFKGGFSNIDILFGNLEKYREFYALSSQDKVLTGLLMHRFGIKSHREIIELLRVVIDIIAITTCCIAFLNNNRERLTLAIAAVIALCPEGAMPYTQLYLFIPFLMFLNRVSVINNKLDIFMAAGYILLLMPYQLEKKTNELFILFVLPAMLAAQCLLEIYELGKSGKNFRQIITDCFKEKTASICPTKKS